MGSYKTTIEESSYGLFHLSLRSADETKNALSEITGQIHSSLQEIKLKYNLSVPFLAITQVTLENSKSIKNSLKDAISKRIIKIYFDDLADYSVTYGNNIKVTSFLAIKDEIDYYKKEINKSGRSTSIDLYFPNTSLYNLSKIIFHKRFPECKLLWIEDWNRKNNPNFIPSLPMKVYEYWKGEEKKYDVLPLAPMLWQYFLTHYSLIYDSLRLIDIKY